MRVNKNLNNYYKKLTKYRLLSKDEELDLAVKIKNGNKTALNTLITSNLLFVATIANKYSKKYNIDVDRLISAGNLGLINATKHFNSKQNCKFVSYAGYYIVREIMNELANIDIIRTPINYFGITRKYIKTKHELEQTGLIPTNHEITERLKKTIPTINKTALKNIYLSIYNYVSMDTIIRDSDLSLHETIIDSKQEDSNNIQSIKLLIDYALNKLTKIEYDIIVKYYNYLDDNNYTLDNLSKLHNLSRERIRQIKVQALTKLATHIKKTKNYQ
jgi:RNA polymerase primary sigma factor